MPDEVVVCGWEASGSTPIAQQLRLLGLEVKKRHGYEAGERAFFTIRDPRDVLCTQARRFAPDDWAGGDYEEPLLDALTRFVMAERLAAFWQAKDDPACTIVRYELFLPKHPERLLRFLGDQFRIGVEPAVAARILDLTSLKRNKRRSEQFDGFGEYHGLIHGDHITTDGRGGAWREAFTPRVERAVDTLLGKDMRALGYA